MTGRARIAVIALVLLASLAFIGLVLFTSAACPGATDRTPCPDAVRNRAAVVALAALGAGLLVTPFAFLGEFVARRRIVFRGAWWRAARRGLLVAAVLATIAALRLGGALTIPVSIFVALLAGAVEWFASVMLDGT